MYYCLLWAAVADSPLRGNNGDPWGKSTRKFVKYKYLPAILGTWHRTSREYIECTLIEMPLPVCCPHIHPIRTGPFADIYRHNNSPPSLLCSFLLSSVCPSNVFGLNFLGWNLLGHHLHFIQSRLDILYVLLGAALAFLLFSMRFGRLHLLSSVSTNYNYLCHNTIHS